MRRLSPTNTRWRDRYASLRVWGLIAAAGLHVGLLFFLPGGIADRLHEALIPSPSVLFRPGAPGQEMEVVETRLPPRESPPILPEPKEREEARTPVVEPETTAEITIAETELASAAIEEAPGSAEGVSEGEADAEPSGGGGGGRMSPPRPLHLVVPRIPGDIDKKRARGESVHLLVQVLADGSVGEVRIEKGSRFESLDEAALSAARRMRYTPARRGGVEVARWTRAEMRF